MRRKEQAFTFLMNWNSLKIWGKMLCSWSSALTARPAVSPLQLQAQVCACPSKSWHRQPLSNSLVEICLLSPKLTGLTLADCWDHRVGRQYSAVSLWQINIQENYLRVETAVLGLGEGKPIFPVTSLGLHRCKKDDNLFCMIKSCLVIAKCFPVN